MTTKIYKITFCCDCYSLKRTMGTEWCCADCGSTSFESVDYDAASYCDAWNAMQDWADQERDDAIRACVDDVLDGAELDSYPTPIADAAEAELHGRRHAQDCIKAVNAAWQLAKHG